jgi:hypothetical protein
MVTDREKRQMIVNKWVDLELGSEMWNVYKEIVN